MKDDGSLENIHSYWAAAFTISVIAVCLAFGNCNRKAEAQPRDTVPLWMCSNRWVLDPFTLKPRPVGDHLRFMHHWVFNPASCVPPRVLIEPRSAYVDFLPTYSEVTAENGMARFLDWNPEGRFIPGDQNSDGEVGLDDILAVLDAFAGRGVWPRADVFPVGGGNGVVEMDDVLCILNLFAGLTLMSQPEAGPGLSLPADIDDNGKIDLADLVIAVAQINSPVMRTHRGDVNHDGTFDDRDVTEVAKELAKGE